MAIKAGSDESPDLIKNDRKRNDKRSHHRDFDGDHEWRDHTGCNHARALRKRCQHWGGEQVVDKRSPRPAEQHDKDHQYGTNRFQQSRPEFNQVRHKSFAGFFGLLCVSTQVLDPGVVVAVEAT